MTSLPNRAPEALLFDLGRVLIDIDFNRAIAAWAPYSALPPDVVRQCFKQDLQYDRHERGEISAQQYFDHLATTLQLDASTEQIEAGWNAIFVGEITPTRQWVESLKGVLPCHAFTNTNASHMACWSQAFPRVVECPRSHLRLASTGAAQTRARGLRPRLFAHRQGCGLDPLLR